MDDLISGFIEKQKCANVSCIDSEGNPYCFSCFYAFNAADGLLYFKSSAGTHHMKLIKNNPVIAGTILPDRLPLVGVKGIQFQGLVLSFADRLSEVGSKSYHRKYPFARVISGEVWVIQLLSIKMTDSSIGFGKKIMWTINEATVV